MAMSVCYTNFCGILVHEKRGATEMDYVPDTLGSQTRGMLSNGTEQFSADYWPYGEVRTIEGSNPSPWGFVGLLGYFTDFTRFLYVRARYYLARYGRWLTVDPMWPIVNKYGYSEDCPTRLTDPSGLLVVGLIIPIGLSAAMLALLEALAILLGVALLVLLILLLLYSFAEFMRQLCGMIRSTMKDVCGDHDRPKCDVSEGQCTFGDSCTALLYKGAAYARCAALRHLETQVCWGGIFNLTHLEQYLTNLRLAGTCAAIFKSKGCDTLAGQLLDHILYAE